MNPMLVSLFFLASVHCVRAAEELDFGRDVQPILSDRCYSCHGQDAEARESGLRLDRREAALVGGDSGSPAIVPGDPAASGLVERIHSHDPDELMPPAKAKKPLTAAQKEVLVRWISEGAKYAGHWSFGPIKRQSLPALKSEKWVRNPIDRFVLARLEGADLTPASEADRATYIRRVTLDLTGLPPTPTEMADFRDDLSPEAYEKVVDRLLSGTDYSERMASIWLDNARYADSNGYQFDNARTMWPWRDWVINAFRENMPYDRFVTEQLAGDLLENPTQEQLMATGFNRNHGYSIEGGIIDEEYRVTYAKDKTNTAGTLFLGLTMECTSCHDHKYDPLSMADYYSLYAFFNTSAEAGAPGDPGFKNKVSAPYVEYREAAATAADGKGKPKAPLVMIMKDVPRETFVLNQGQFDQPGEKVVPRTPDVLPSFKGYPSNRLGLAQWLTSPENPLFARVAVNRIWQQFFGAGLVRTPDNFGLQGEPPTHPQLLDWLAADFRESGWDIHHLIRQIVLSSTYRQDSSRRPGIDDPENRLLARGPSFRLPAETIRDQALAVSGLLTRKVGGPSVKPYQPEGIWEDLNAPKSHAEIYQQASGPDLYRKSMYTYWRRAAMHPMMASFDAPNRDVCTVERPTTNTPLQALALMNGPTFVEASRKLAERVLGHGPGDTEARVHLAVEITLNRTPTPKETEILSGVFSDRLAQYRKDPAAADRLLAIGESQVDPAMPREQLAALADTCLVILNLSETVTRK